MSWPLIVGASVGALSLLAMVWWNRRPAPPRPVHWRGAATLALLAGVLAAIVTAMLQAPQDQPAGDAGSIVIPAPTPPAE